MVRAISVYSAGVPYAVRFTAAVKIPLPLAICENLPIRVDNFFSDLLIKA